MPGDCCSSSYQFEPNTTACGDAGTECTNQDTCDATGTCTDNGFQSEGTSCGDTGTECTHQDTCNATGACSDNGFQSQGSLCGDPAGQCTLADNCDGAGACTDGGQEPDGLVCNDADPGTIGDQCNAGVCEGTTTTAIPALSLLLRTALLAYLVGSAMLLLRVRLTRESGS